MDAPRFAWWAPVETTMALGIEVSWISTPLSSLTRPRVYHWCCLAEQVLQHGSRQGQRSRQLACLGHVADSAVGRLEKETGLVPAAVARDFQRTVSKVAFPGLLRLGQLLEDGNAAAAAVPGFH